LLNSGNGSLIAWPQAVYIRDFSATTNGVLVPCNISLTMHLALYDESGWYMMTSYGNLSYPTLWDLNTTPSKCNFTTYNTWGQDILYNGSIYSGIFLTVSGTQMYDWYQFIASENNFGSGNQTWVYSFYDNPWYANSIPTMNGGSSFINGANQNATYEMGIAIRTFYIMINGVNNWGGTNMVNPSNLTEIKLNIASYHVPIMKVDLVKLQNAFTSASTPLPSWVLPVVIVGGVAVVAVIVVVILLYKKKHPI
jgi:hypothetical protein